MLITIIQLIAIFAVPALILKFRNGKLTKMFGTIGMAYFYGLIVAVAVWLVNCCGIEFSLNSDIGEIGSYAAIGIAIPLLLFSSNLLEVRQLSKTVLLSYGSLVVSVIIIAAAASFIFRNGLESCKELSAMSVGLYTGGTPNFNAIGAIVGADSRTIALGNLSDMIIGGIFYVFILLALKPILTRILGSGKNSVYSKSDSSVNVDELSAMKLHRGIVRNFILAVLCAVIGAGIGVLIWVLKGSVQGTMTDYLVPAIMISVTVFGIVLSFSKPIREVRENSICGHYLILVFSFALASSLNLSNISSDFIHILLLLAFITVCSAAVHVIISKLLKIDADCTIITMTAGIYGPAFVPAVAGQLKNEKLLAPGLICGSLGYAIGTFIGLGLWAII